MIQNNLFTLLPIFLAVFACAITLLMAFSKRGGKFLCLNCRFNNDNDCRKIERPEAIICHAFRESTDSNS
ncbi:MAG: hypothetical protein K2X27_02750 [Candidatus Obscuribacterales bacterium]|nr:hypothetical protein [Candidatus Obscuribacterales bacterium]